MGIQGSLEHQLLSVFCVNCKIIKMSKLLSINNFRESMSVFINLIDREQNINILIVDLVSCLMPHPIRIHVRHITIMKCIIRTKITIHDQF